MRKGAAVWLAVLACLASSDCSRARADTPIIEYRSDLGTIPLAQGWRYDSRCLKENCPVPEPGFPNQCWWQGSQDLNGDMQPDNNCEFTIGCHKPDQTAHYNSPAPQNISDGCSYTEWVTFDDGNNQNNRLTIPDSPARDSPPWGAPGFVRAPLTHAPLRISTGDGNDVAEPLPTLPPVNNRNRGKVAIRRDYTFSGLDNAVTVVAKLAVGPFHQDHAFLQVQTPNYLFGFTVNGQSDDPNRGRIGYTDELFGLIDYLFPERTVSVTSPGTPGPHAGEFFTLRVVCRDDGTFTAWLNDDAAYDTPAEPIPELPGPSPQVVFGTISTGDECIWVDYVQLFDGEVPPPVCPDPVFDVNRDGQVDTVDFTIEPSGFVRCETGPAPSAAVFSALSAECQCLDVNGDQAVDMRDFAVFQRCLTTGNGLIDPACDD